MVETILTRDNETDTPINEMATTGGTIITITTIATLFRRLRNCEDVDLRYTIL